MIKKWLALIAIIPCTLMLGSDGIKKNYLVPAPGGIISIGLPNSWSLGYNEAAEAIKFEPSELKKTLRLAGEVLFIMHKREGFFSDADYQGLVSISYKSNQNEPLDWEDLLEYWRTDTYNRTQFADGIKRPSVKKLEKKTVNGIDFYFHESAFDKFTVLPAKDGGDVMINPCDIYYKIISLGDKDYLLTVDVTYWEDKYYTKKYRDRNEQEVLALFKSFSFQHNKNTGTGKRAEP